MLERLLDWILYSIIGLDPSLKWVESLTFFVYDSIKIMLLLFVMISIIGFLRTYIPQDKIKEWISSRRYWSGNVLASVFGVVTPFCSCSSIPIFLSFLEAGIPLGATLSFLITSPLVNEYLIVLMLGFFGWKITLAYITSGVFIGVVSGIILGKLNLEKHLVKDLSSSQTGITKSGSKISERVGFGLNESFSILKKLWLWILIGVGVGALIHNYVPSQLIQSVVTKGGLFSVPLAVFLGVPMYGSCAAILPVAFALFEKGMPLGTTLAFVMAISALSFPEAVILRRAMKLKLIGIFFGVVAIAIILTGYVFNLLQNIFL